MPFRLPLICVLIVLLLSLEAYADEKFEIVPKSGLLLLGDFNQWVSTEYQYSDHKSPGTNFLSHDLQERYHFDTGFSIVDQHLLRLLASGEISPKQGWSHSDANSSSSNELLYQYSIFGNAFDQGWHPVSFHTSRSLSTVVSPYTPTFNSDASSKGIAAFFAGKPVQTKFIYERTTLDTSGGGSNSSSVNDQFQVSATHNYREIMATDLNATLFRQRNNAGMTDGYVVTFVNSLGIDRKRNHTLASSLVLQETSSLGVPQSSIDLSEGLRDRYGKALESDINYRFNSNKTLSFTGSSQESTSNSVSASLRHHFLEAITSSLHGRAARSNFLDGTEERYSGAIAVGYRKKLPAAGQFSLDVSDEHEVTSRNIKTTDLTVRDEPHFGVQQGDTFTLVVSGVLLSVASVTNSSRTITYVEGRDYTVDPLLRRITIVPGGTIAPPPPGNDLLISYIIRLDPSLKYATDTVSLASRLAFLNGRYILSGLFVVQSQDQISGQAAFDLNASRMAELRFQGIYGANAFSLDGFDYSSNHSKYKYLEGSWQVNRRFHDASISFQLKERYTLYDATATAAGYGQNTLNAMSSYTRYLSSWAQLLLTATYIDTTGGRLGKSDFVYFSGKLQTRFNKLAINLTGQTAWRFYGQQYSRDDYMLVELMRYF